MAKWNLVAMGQVGLSGWTGKVARPVAHSIARKTGTILSVAGGWARA